MRVFAGTIGKVSLNAIFSFIMAGLLVNPRGRTNEALKWTRLGHTRQSGILGRKLQASGGDSKTCRNWIRQT